MTGVHQFPPSGIIGVREQQFLDFLRIDLAEINPLNQSLTAQQIGFIEPFRQGQPLLVGHGHASARLASQILQCQIGECQMHMLDDACATRVAGSNRDIQFDIVRIEVRLLAMVDLHL
ncbi:hypothetical protein D3C81_1112890 [compost metagenome]